MGTNNFAVRNASRYFVIEGWYEDEETGEEVHYEQWDWDAEIDYIQEALKEKGYGTNGDYTNDNRNFPAQYLAHKYNSKNFMGIEMYVEVTSVIRSGYYQGANLDYEINVSMEGHGGHDLDEITEEYLFEMIEDYNDGENRGMMRINAIRANNWITREVEQLTEEIEKVFDHMTTPYVKTGGFSDGTAVYEKV